MVERSAFYNAALGERVATLSECALDHRASRLAHKLTLTDGDAAKGAAADHRANLNPPPLPDPPAANGKSSRRLIKSFHRRGVPGISGFHHALTSMQLQGSIWRFGAVNRKRRGRRV
jgi:hypothetical protein